MTTLQKTLIAATLVAAVGTGIYEASKASRLRKEVETLQQQETPLTEQIQRLTRERADAMTQLTASRDEIERLNRNSAELLKLRGEVARLRNNSTELAQSKAADADDPTQIQMKSWMARVNQVKQRFEETPGSKIPELEFLLEQDWLDATKGNLLKTDEDYRKAMAGLRLQAATRFGILVQGALSKYSKANEGHFPSELSQLEPYFTTPAESAVLQRYQIIPAIYLGDEVAQSGLGEWAITQKAALDEQADLRVAIGKYVINWGFRMQTDSALDSVISAFAAANNGRLPQKIQDLKSYVSTPAEQAAFEKRITFDRNRRNPSSVPIISDAFPHQYQ